METQDKLTLMQNIYAASVAETANTYERLGALCKVVEAKKQTRAMTAPILVRQLGITKKEEVFSRNSEVFGCANWNVKREGIKFTATASSCKLCSLAKKLGGANPCRGWCLDPIISMLMEIDKTIDESKVEIVETLMEGTCCRVIVSDNQ